MPFTTMSNYNWLFDMGADNTMNATSLTPSRAEPPLTQLTNDALHSFQQGTNIMQPENHFPGFAYRQSSNQNLDSSGHHALRIQNLAGDENEQIRNVNLPLSSSSARDEAVTQLSQGFSASSVSPEAFSTTQSSLPSSHTSYAQYSPTTQRKQSSQHQRQPGVLLGESNALPSLHPYYAPRKLPRLDEQAQRRVLDLVVSAGTCNPDGTLVAREQPLLSLSALQDYSDLFFSRFNSCYPLIHKATFDPLEVDPLFLLSVLLLGATYGDKDAHRLAVCIHDVMRAQIFQHPDFTATPPLWMLQTIMLVECFGKSRAGQKQHDMAHLFHGLLIK